MLLQTSQFIAQLDRLWLLLAALFLFLVLLAYYFIVRRPRRKILPLRLPESKFLTLGNIRFHYWDEGTGFPLVLIHGIGGSNYVWRFIFWPLAKKFRVIAFDLVGFGQSSKPKNFSYSLDSQTKIIDKFLTELGIKKYSLVGSSMGGAISLFLAKSFPNKVKKLVLLAPATDPKIAPFALNTFAPFARLFSFTGSPLIMRNILSILYVNKEKLINDESIQVYGSPYKMDGKAVYAFIKAVNLLRDKRLPIIFKDLKQPMLLMWGEHDKMVPRQSIDLLINTLDTPPKVVLDPKSGHHSMEDNPELTIKSLMDFL